MFSCLGQFQFNEELLNWEREREKERALVTTLSASHERVLIHIKTHTPTLRNQTVRSVHQTESMQPGSVLHVPVTTAMHTGLHTQPQQRERNYIICEGFTPPGDDSRMCRFCKKNYVSQVCFDRHVENVANWIGVKCINGTSSSFSSSFEEGGLSRLDEGPAMVSSSSRVRTHQVWIASPFLRGAAGLPVSRWRNHHWRRLQHGRRRQY